MNSYETVFILTPVLSDQQMKEAVDKFKNLLESEGAVILNEENWGLKKLAYPIQKKSTGFYAFIEFDAEPTLIEKLEINFRRDERVLRFLTFRQDKFAKLYAEKRRSLKASAPQTEEAETVESPAPAKLAPEAEKVEITAAPLPQATVEEAAPAVEEMAAEAPAAVEVQTETQPEVEQPTQNKEE